MSDRGGVIVIFVLYDADSSFGGGRRGAGLRVPPGPPIEPPMILCIIRNIYRTVRNTYYIQSLFI